MGPHAMCVRARTPPLIHDYRKVKQVAWMFIYQLVGGMGTTLWCKDFFFSMLVVEAKWLNGYARMRTLP